MVAEDGKRLFIPALDGNASNEGLEDRRVEISMNEGRFKSSGFIVVMLWSEGGFLRSVWLAKRDGVDLSGPGESDARGLEIVVVERRGPRMFDSC